MEEAPTPEEQRETMNLHLRHKAQEIIEKFGANITFNVLQDILQDRKSVRYPVNIIFDSTRVDAGLFLVTEMVLTDLNRQASDDDVYTKQADRHYDFFIHEHFEGHPEKLVPLILYHLPTVNYGDIATCEDAEIFGAALLQMEEDDYYQLVCDLVDGIPG